MSEHRFLVIAYDRLGPCHAGPAIRTLALARELSSIAHVDIIFEGEPPGSEYDRISFIPAGSFKPSPDFFNRYRLALAPPLVALILPELFESDIPVVLDLFDPVIWENLELYRNRGDSERAFQHERHLAALIAGLIRSDYFIVAGQRQQDLFLGALMALNRVSPATWLPDAGLEQLIGFVPFGLPSESPPSARDIPLPTDFATTGPLVVWGGGMWDWMKPEIIIHAWKAVLDRFPDARLAFTGTDHPNPHVPEMASVGRVRKLAKSLGLLESLIFGRWLPRDEYLGLLAHAGLGVSAHAHGLEARYAVRTRFLDAIWLGLPMVVSGGDEYSHIIVDNGLGLVVDDPDPAAFSEAILLVLESGKEAYTSGFDHARTRLTWQKTARPLIDWASAPRSTHGPGSEFFQDTLGSPTPRGRPADISSLLARIISRLSKP